MNVSNRHKFVIPTRGPYFIRDFRHAAKFMATCVVSLLMWCGLMWLGFTLWPVIRGCLG